MIENLFDTTINHLIKKYYLNNIKSIAICFSGGIDSAFLLHIANNWCKLNSINLTAIHVDHKLRSDSSQQAQEIAAHLSKIGISNKILVWEHHYLNSGIQTHARNARYELISQYCEKNKIDIALTAHNLNDQVEQILISLSQGAGIYSFLIPEYSKINNNNYLRPLLKIEKKAIINYVKTHNIRWWNDSSNQEKKYLRNKFNEIAESILRISEDKRILTAIDNIKRSSITLTNLANNFIKNKVINSNLGYSKLKLTEFSDLEDELKYSVLRNIIQRVARQNSDIRIKSLKNIITEILGGKNFQKSLAGCLIILDSDYLIFIREFGRRDPDILAAKNGIWDLRFSVSENNHIIKNLCMKDISNLIKIAPNILEFDLNISRKIKKKILLTLPGVFVLEKLIAIPHIYYDEVAEIVPQINYIEA